MALMSDERKLMKRDTQGRVVVPVARREALLDEFERSGLCGAEFARKRHAQRRMKSLAT
jgi:hypothetical protein